VKLDRWPQRSFQAAERAKLSASVARRGFKARDPNHYWPCRHWYSYDNFGRSKILAEACKAHRWSYNPWCHRKQSTYCCATAVRLPILADLPI